jgi:hypothetical protein
MPTFINESGDTGHARHSLPYFRLAAVWIPTLAAADLFRADVRRLRQDLEVGEKFEFKFARTHSHPERRRAFFDCAAQHDFRFSFCGIDKTGAYWGRAPAEEQHWATAASIAACLRQVYHQAEQSIRPLRDPVLVDDNGDKGFLKAIRIAFRGLQSQLHPGVPMVSNPRFRGSATDEVMHLVDMVCGAAGACLDGDSTCYDLIKPKCMGLMRLP